MKLGLGDSDLISVVIAAFILIAAIPSAFYIIVGNEGLRLSSIIVSGGLSLALVALYKQQQEILEKQTELMNREFQSAISLYPLTVAEDDNIIMKLRNEGRGKVRRIFLRSEMISETGDLEVAPARTLVKKEEDNSVEVPSESIREKYSAEVRLAITSSDNPEDTRKLPFRMIARALSGQGIDNCSIKLTLEVLDERVTNDDISYEIDLAEQELELNPPETTESGGQKSLVTTTIEQGIKKPYSSSQDINKEWFESIGDQ